MKMNDDDDDDDEDDEDDESDDENNDEDDEDDDEDGDEDDEDDEDGEDIFIFIFIFFSSFFWYTRECKVSQHDYLVGLFFEKKQKSVTGRMTDRELTVRMPFCIVSILPTVGSHLIHNFTMNATL